MSDNVWSSFTLYFDGSHKKQANKAGAGCIIRDSQGKVVIAAAYNLTETFPEYCNVAIAEAAALRNGLQLAKDNSLKLNLIKGDNKEVIDRVEDRSRRPSKSPLLSGIIQQIIGMIDHFSLQIVLINREANKPADKLASIGSNMHYGGKQIFRTPADLPPQVTELVKQDMIDRSSVQIVLINWEANKPADKLASIGSSMDYGGRQIFRTPADLPPQVTELVKQDMSYGSSSEAEDKGEGSSMAETIGMAGAAVAGIGMIGWGIFKLMSGDQNTNKFGLKRRKKNLFADCRPWRKS